MLKEINSEKGIKASSVIYRGEDKSMNKICNFILNKTYLLNKRLPIILPLIGKRLFIYNI